MLQQGDQVTLDTQLKKGEIYGILYIVAVQRPAQPNQPSSQPTDRLRHHAYDEHRLRLWRRHGDGDCGTVVASNVNLGVAGRVVPPVQPVYDEQYHRQRYTYIDIQCSQNTFYFFCQRHSS